ncbi:retrovirus-related pol polyprotein from transposon TNT 1-94 [Tanacetum coccineum]
MVAKVPQTLEYRGGQLNAAPMLEVKNSTNWKKRFMCHIIGVEPLFKSIIQDGPYVPMTVGNIKPESQWSEEFHERALLTKSNRFFKKGSQRFNDAKATDETQCYKYGRKCHFSSDCFSKTLVPSFSSAFQNNYQPKLFSPSQQKPELGPTKDFKAKYNNVNAKLALLSSGALTSKSSMVKNKGLVTEAYEWDEEDVSSNDNEMVEVKLLMTLDDENVVVGKESARNGEWVKISIRKFDEKKGIIFNSNKEVVMIALRVRDVYVLDMTSSAQQSCFISKASESLNWLWHKRLAHLNFKTINQLAKQNLFIGLPSLIYSKDKPCLSCEKGKHHRANFKTKQTSSIKICLHLLHIDLFRPITPKTINHEKYTLVLVTQGTLGYTS